MKIECGIPVILRYNLDSEMGCSVGIADESDLLNMPLR
jgi:hypothetical protein